MANEAGKIEAIKLWGRVCDRQGGCEVCPVGAMRAANVTCAQFAEQNPEKFLSILQEIDASSKNEIYSYYGEFCLRFPECRQPVENLAKMMCRRAVFEGYPDCIYPEKERTFDKCIACWKAAYVGDVDPTTVSHAEGNGTPSVDDSKYNSEDALNAILGD